MNLLVASLALGFSLGLALCREEVHHIHSEQGRNVHIHLHEVGNCEDKAEHHHHHDGGDKSGHASEMMSKPMAKKKKGKRGKKNKMMSDEPDMTMTGEKGDHPHHHEGDDDIHIHIHEAGENCSKHDHGEHHGGHRMHRGGHACAMCARQLRHHGDSHHDHPSHHGPHSHEEGSDKHDHAEDYVYAHCDMAPNNAMPKKKRSKVAGAVHLRQLIYGGPVEMNIELNGFKTDHKGGMQHMHGMHVHEFGDLSNGCQSTGSHFNPFGMLHGAPTDDIRHAGDYGNIHCNEEGIANLEMNDSRSTMIGHHNIIGRALVIHEKEDDMGKGGNAASLKTGDAGGRLACCIIVRAKPHGHWKSDVHDHSEDHHHHDHGDNMDLKHHDQGHDGHKKHMDHGSKNKHRDKDHDHSHHGHH